MPKARGIESMPDLITVNQAAALMSVTVRRVRALLESGKLRGRNYGHQWLIRRGVLARYMAARETRLRGTPHGRFLPPAKVKGTRRK